MSQVEYDVDGEEEEETQMVVVEDPPADDPPLEEDIDEEDNDDTRLGGGREEDDEDDADKKRSKNRTRRQKQKEARERTERELSFLRNRNEDLERRFSRLEADTATRLNATEIEQLDERISSAKSDLKIADTVMSQALEANDNAKFVEALGHRDNMRDQLRDLEATKDYIAQEASTPRQEETPELDARHVAHAQQFMVDNEWWDPQSRRGDNGVIYQLDLQLANEGYNPATKEYWDELRARTEEALPHHFGGAAGGGDDDGGDDATDREKETVRRDSRSRGPVMRTGGRERPLKDNEVYISPERKEAMIEAGVWDDPKQRNEYLKAYAKYDREAREGS